MIKYYIRTWRRPAGEPNQEELVRVDSKERETGHYTNCLELTLTYGTHQWKPTICCPEKDNMREITEAEAAMLLMELK